MTFQIYFINEIPNLTDIFKFLIFFMKFQKKFFFYKTALIIAIEQENVEIVKLLLDHPDINVNIKSILNQPFECHLKMIYLNFILKI